MASASSTIWCDLRPLMSAMKPTPQESLSSADRRGPAPPAARDRRTVAIEQARVNGRNSGVVALALASSGPRSSRRSHGAGHRPPAHHPRPQHRSALRPKANQS